MRTRRWLPAPPDSVAECAHLVGAVLAFCWARLLGGALEQLRPRLCHGLRLRGCTRPRLHIGGVWRLRNPQGLREHRSKSSVPQVVARTAVECTAEATSACKFALVKFAPECSPANGGRLRGQEEARACCAHVDSDRRQDGCEHQQQHGPGVCPRAHAPHDHGDVDGRQVRGASPRPSAIMGAGGGSSWGLLGLLMLGVHGAAAFTAPATFMPVCGGRCGDVQAPLLQEADGLSCPLRRFSGRTLSRWRAARQVAGRCGGDGLLHLYMH